MLITTTYGVHLFSNDFSTEKLYWKQANMRTGRDNLALIEPTSKSLVVAQTSGYGVEWGHTLWQWDPDGATQELTDSLQNVGIVAWATCIDKTRCERPHTAFDKGANASPSSYLFTSDPTGCRLEVRALCFRDSASAYDVLRAFDLETGLSREGLVAMDKCAEPLNDRKSLSCKRLASGRRSDILRRTSAVYLRRSVSQEPSCASTDGAEQMEEEVEAEVFAASSRSVAQVCGQTDRSGREELETELLKVDTPPDQFSLSCPGAGQQWADKSDQNDHFPKYSNFEEPTNSAQPSPHQSNEYEKRENEFQLVHMSMPQNESAPS